MRTVLYVPQIRFSFLKACGFRFGILFTYSDLRSDLCSDPMRPNVNRLLKIHQLFSINEKVTAFRCNCTMKRAILLNVNSIEIKIY
uniref:AlNc14C118G6599 protein n=1 Tax=Albugo laibachii Nc14 TaxID=890382 RepID=F0WJ67_9STRA|nr:AlNc14C118G6599 [Albugo laibachii Nc14]|eukprot:CCA21314.1 AlNc14C118G6599 [Albugo laibachii Nc14]